MRQYLLAIAVIIVVGACAKPIPVNLTPQPVSGSKADGMVRVAYTEHITEIVTADWEGAKAEALQRCQAWGYTRVDEFAGISRECDTIDQYGNCLYRTVSRDYQCLD